MKILFTLLPLVLLVACEGEDSTTRANKINKDLAAYGMTCTHDLTPNSPSFIKRCENSEVVCYTYNNGLACKFKSP